MCNTWNLIILILIEGASRSKSNELSYICGDRVLHVPGGWDCLETYCSRIVCYLSAFVAMLYRLRMLFMHGEVRRSVEGLVVFCLKITLRRHT